MYSLNEYHSECFLDNENNSIILRQLWITVHFIDQYIFDVMILL